MPSSLRKPYRKCLRPSQISSARAPNTRRRTCDFTDQISVLVGPNEQAFLVLKDIICAKSKFFAAACSERWVEGKEKKVTLPDVSASVLQSYLVWVYCGRLDITCVSSEDIDYLPNERCEIAAKYFELYFLGDAFDDIRLRNRVSETIVLDIRDTLSPSIVTRVWEKTPDSSPARRMIVDRAYLRGKRTFLLDNLTKFPQDFVQQVAAVLLQEVPTKEKDVFTAKLPSYLEPLEKVG